MRTWFIISLAAALIFLSACTVQSTSSSPDLTGASPTFVEDLAANQTFTTTATPTPGITGSPTPLFVTDTTIAQENPLDLTATATLTPTLTLTPLPSTTGLSLSSHFSTFTPKVSSMQLFPTATRFVSGGQPYRAPINAAEAINHPADVICGTGKRESGAF